MSEVAVEADTVALTGPTHTILLAATALKPDPVTVTEQPTGPDFGEKLVMEGLCAAAHSGSHKIQGMQRRERMVAFIIIGLIQALVEHLYGSLLAKAHWQVVEIVIDVPRYK